MKSHNGRISEFPVFNFRNKMFSNQNAVLYDTGRNCSALGSHVHNLIKRCEEEDLRDLVKQDGSTRRRAVFCAGDLATVNRERYGKFNKRQLSRKLPRWRRCWRGHRRSWSCCNRHRLHLLGRICRRGKSQTPLHEVHLPKSLPLL